MDKPLRAESLKTYIEEAAEKVEAKLRWVKFVRDEKTLDNLVSDYQGRRSEHNENVQRSPTSPIPNYLAVILLLNVLRKLKVQDFFIINADNVVYANFGIETEDLLKRKEEIDKISENAIWGTFLKLVIFALLQIDTNLLNQDNPFSDNDLTSLFVKIDPTETSIPLNWIAFSFFNFTKAFGKVGNSPY